MFFLLLNKLIDNCIIECFLCYKLFRRIVRRFLFNVLLMILDYKRGGKYVDFVFFLMLGDKNVILGFRRLSFNVYFE